MSLEVINGDLDNFEGLNDHCGFMRGVDVRTDEEFSGLMQLVFGTVDPRHDGDRPLDSN